MTKYRIPCWINIQKQFCIDIEAESPTNAILNLRGLLESSNPKDIDYIEECISNGDMTGLDGPVDYDDDISLVEEVL